MLQPVTNNQDKINLDFHLREQKPPHHALKVFVGEVQVKGNRNGYIKSYVFSDSWMGTQLKCCIDGLVSLESSMPGSEREGKIGSWGSGLQCNVEGPVMVENEARH